MFTQQIKEKPRNAAFSLAVGYLTRSLKRQFDNARYTA